MEMTNVQLLNIQKKKIEMLTRTTASSGFVDNDDDGGGDDDDDGLSACTGDDEYEV